MYFWIEEIQGKVDYMTSSASQESNFYIQVLHVESKANPLPSWWFLDLKSSLL